MEQVIGGQLWAAPNVIYGHCQFMVVRPNTFHVMLSSLRFILILSALMIEQLVTEEIWQQDLSKDMQIGASTGGFDQVNLRCGAEKMVVSLQTAEDFEGVIYTQGSFYSKQPPCFLDPTRGGNFTINIPFNECHTENEDNRYKNILVMQHDDELITPGDAAFILECDFSKPRNIIVSAELKESDEREVRSSISLVDPDPGRDESKRAAYVESHSDRVFYVPNSIPKINDEL